MVQGIMLEGVDKPTLLKFCEGVESALTAIQGTLTPPQKTVFLSQDEVAELLKVSKVTVWSHTKTGLLKSYRVGNQVRYIESEVIQAVTGKAIGKGAKTNG
jgi:excisionase family DNA binding protein